MIQGVRPPDTLENAQRIYIGEWGEKNHDIHN